MKNASLLLLSLLAACAGRPGPRDVAERYARALQEGRLEEARALTTEPAAADYGNRFASAQEREERAAQVRAEAAALEARSAHLTLVQTPVGWRVREGARDEAAREALRQFIGAVDAGRWNDAYALLAGPLRARYTPARLQSDFRLEPLARERLERARAALAGPVQLSSDGARLSVGPGRAVLLVQEGGGHRVAALE